MPIDRVSNPPPPLASGRLVGARGLTGASPQFQPSERKGRYVGENMLGKRGVRGLGLGARGLWGWELGARGLGAGERGLGG